MVRGAVDVRLALEAERKNASLGLLLIGVLGADEADLLALGAAAPRPGDLTLLTLEGLLFLVVEGATLDALQDLRLRMNGLNVWRSKSSTKLIGKVMEALIHGADEQTSLLLLKMPILAIKPDVWNIWES